MRNLNDAPVRSQRVLLRVDLNVPVDAGKVSDTTRITRIVPTIRELAEKGARVILLSHFGRPKGQDRASHSLRPLAPVLAAALNRPVYFAEDCVGDVAASAVASLQDGDVLLLENTRFHAGEEANDTAFVEALACLGDMYVNDAFSAAHRAHASSEGLAHKLSAYAGRAMQQELDALERALSSPQRPLAAIVGGAKVSTKLDLLGNLIHKVNILIIGGGMANTFLLAQGYNVGQSLAEPNMIETARAILVAAEKSACHIVLPQDVHVAKIFAAHAPSRFTDLRTIAPEERILDIGPKSVAAIIALLQDVKTLIWNGPFGAFELPPFDLATREIAKAVANQTLAGRLVSIAGGGDTVAALNATQLAESFTYVSTAGGAFLEWMEGKTLPGVAALHT